MPLYEATFPDGRVYEVDSPHALSNQEVIQHVQAQSQAVDMSPQAAQHAFFRSPWVGAGMNVLGGLGGGALGIMAAGGPEDVPGAIAGARWGGAGGMAAAEALREKLAGQDLSPTQIGATGVAGYVFPGVADMFSKGMGLAGDALAQGGATATLPAIARSAALPTGFINRALAPGLASAMINPPLVAGQELLAGRGPQAAYEQGIGAVVPSLVGGTAAGAAFEGAGRGINAVGGQFNRQPIPPNAVLNKAEELSQQVAPAVRGGTEEAQIPPQPGQAVPFDALDQQARNVLQSARTNVYGVSGNLEGPLVNATKIKSDAAWAPMEQLTQSITTPFTGDDIKNELFRMFPADAVRFANAEEAALTSAKAAGLRGFFPERAAMQETGAAGARQMQASLEDLQSLIQKNPSGAAGSNLAAMNEIEAAKIKNSATAQQLNEMAIEAGKRIASSYKAGTAGLTGDDLPFVDLRTAIGNLLERNAPPEMKGFARQANQNWKEFVTQWRNPLDDYLAPGKMLEPSDTQQRINRLTAAAKNPQSEGGRFLSGVEQEVGVPIISPLQETNMRMADVASQQSQRASDVQAALKERIQSERAIVPELLKVGRGTADEITMRKISDIEAKTGIQIAKPMQDIYDQYKSQQDRENAIEKWKSYGVRFVAFRMLWGMLPK